MPRLLGAGLLGALLLLPAHADALELGEADGRPIRLDITESLLVNWHSTLDDKVAGEHDNIFSLINRLNTRLTWNKLTLGLRIDAAWFPNAPTDEYQNDIRPEELYIKYRIGKLRLTLGDEYVSFGRGLALTLRKFDELGYDLNLRGVHALFKHKVFKAQLTTGITNVVNVDAVESKLIDDPNDVILGLRLEGRPLKWLKIGGHVVDVERRNSSIYQDLSVIIPGDNTEDVAVNNQFAIRSLVFGGNVELTNVAKALDLYAEVDAVTHENARNTARGRESETDDGLAFYGAATGYMGDLTLLLEAKHYDQYRLKPSAPVESGQALVYEGLTYIAPPSLERIDQRVQNNEDVTGLHLRGDYALPDTGERFFLSGAYFWDIGENHEVNLHTYAGWEHRADNAQDRWLLQAGFRQEEDTTLDQTTLRMVHIDFDLFWLIDGPHDIQFHWSHEFRTKNPGQGGDFEDDYLEGTSYISWNIAPHWSLSFQFEYLTDKQTDDPIFPGGSIVYRIDKSSLIRLFGGRQKGGLKCSGGVCRIFPEFEGMQLETTLRF